MLTALINIAASTLIWVSDVSASPKELLELSPSALLSGSVAGLNMSDITVYSSELYPHSPGPGVPIASSRKRCNLAFGVKLPDGLAVSLSSVDYRGYFILDKGDTFTRLTSYSFQNTSTETATVRGQLSGPFGSGDMALVRDEFNDPATVVTSGCGGLTTLNVAIDLRLSGVTKNGGIIYPPDLSMQATFNLKLSECAT
ncbi:hypothetical protein FA15DRAFT_695583 [Coprinopsis marcescibilis]|uniref:Ubiquitin 3 binding protein But2 C-terminal domain-containing protein n=1 Tax=Coprinopsis marcescibilis TaxID=230819 RepID=A0A5C3KQK6_COPMA|nr:hypothetical protein FA15DRAFT_695583 [Coprinopsis marcescibilis]